MKLIVVIVVFVGIAIVWLVRKRAAYMYVLHARVGTVDGYRYSVVFEELHPETKPVEYVWLCLFFAAKMLYNIGNQAKQVEAKELLLTLIEALGDTDLVASTDLVQETQRPIELSVGEPAAGSKDIVAKVAFFNPMVRHLWTSLPLTWFEFQFPHSFLAIVQASLSRLDIPLRQRLQGSFAKMAELYREGLFDPASRHALTAVPHQAFWDAKVIT